MIKLITQFDKEKSKLSLATPTCGCCCSCCCCCIVSTIATASISARNFGNFVQKELPNEPEKIKYARRVGFWFPIGLIISILIGLIILSVNVSINVVFNVAFIVVAIGIAYLFNLIISVKKKINLKGITSRVIRFTALLGVMEIIGFNLGIYAILYFAWLYLIGAIVLSIIFIFWAFWERYDDLEDNITINNEDISNTNNQLNENINNENNKKNNSNIKTEKKKCPKCGTENIIDNKRCIYCSNFFEEDDKE